MQNIQLDKDGLPDEGNTPIEQGVNTESVDDDSIGLDFFNFTSSPEAIEEPVQAVPLAEDNEVTEESTVSTDGVPTEDNWEIRARYFQSEFDKAKPYIPLVKYIQENPQLLDTIEAQLAKGDQPVTAVPENSKPVRPVRPDNFNTSDAYADASSESGRYLQSMVEYQEQLTDYADKRESEKIRATEATLAEQAAQVEYNAKITEVKQSVKQKYGATDAEVEGFVEAMRNPESINLDNLWVLYQYKQGKLGNNNTANTLNTQNNKIRSFPTPAGISGGGQNKPQAVDANKLFNDSLRS